MAKHVLVAHVGPTSTDQEEEFNRWYDEVHIPQVIERIPGVLSARRLRLVPPAPEGAQDGPPHPYLSIYELDTDDVPALAARLFASMDDGTLDMSPALDLVHNPPVVRFYEPVE